MIVHTCTWYTQSHWPQVRLSHLFKAPHQLLAWQSYLHHLSLQDALPSRNPAVLVPDPHLLLLHHLSLLLLLHLAILLHPHLPLLPSGEHQLGSRGVVFTNRCSCTIELEIIWCSKEVASVTLGVDNPELCQNICQVPRCLPANYAIYQFFYFQADPACVAITWTQESFPIYPLRFLIRLRMILARQGFLSARSNNQNASSWHLKIFLLKQKYIVSEHFLRIILSIEILPLSCATFSSIENATECADCVSG